MTKNPIENLRKYLELPILFSERNGYTPFDRKPALDILDEIEAQYMRVPVDQDGVPIKPLDTMLTGYDEPVTVVAIDDERWFYLNGSKYDYEWADGTRHLRPDVVDKSLEQFLKEFSVVSSDLIGEYISDYAERIRKITEG